MHGEVSKTASGCGLSTEESEESNERSPDKAILRLRSCKKRTVLLT